MDQEQKLEQAVDDLSLKAYKRGLWAAAIIVFVIGGLFIWFGEPEWKAYNPVISVLASVFAAICCTISLNIYEKKKKNIIDRNLNGRLNTIENKLSVTDDNGLGTIIKNELNAKSGDISERLFSIEKKLSLLPAGVKKICSETDFNKENGFDELYKNSNNAMSVLVYGKKFIELHFHAIVSRFEKAGSVSKWFLIDPDSDFLGMISKKTGRTETQIKGYINENVKLLIDKYESSSKLGELEIYYMCLPPMEAVYVFDDTIVECKYYSSMLQVTGNHVIVYENNNDKTSIGNSFVADCSRLEKESKCIFTSHYYVNDKQFMSFLKGKMPYASGWRENDFKKIGFASAYKENGNDIFMHFGCRYYDRQSEFDRNKKMLLAQYKEEEEELRRYGETMPLVFIAGIGDSPNHPRTIRKFRYKPNENEFAPIQSTNLLGRNNFDIPTKS